MYVRANNVWRKGRPWVYVSGQWKKAKASWVFASGQWRKMIYDAIFNAETSHVRPSAGGPYQYTNFQHMAHIGESQMVSASLTTTSNFLPSVPNSVELRIRFHGTTEGKKAAQDFVNGFRAGTVIMSMNAVATAPLNFDPAKLTVPSYANVPVNLYEVRFGLSDINYSKYHGFATVAFVRSKDIWIGFKDNRVL